MNRVMKIKYKQKIPHNHASKFLFKHKCKDFTVQCSECKKYFCKFCMSENYATRVNEKDEIIGYKCKYCL